MTTRIVVCMPESLKAELLQEAEERGQMVSEYARDLLRSREIVDPAEGEDDDQDDEGTDV